MEPRSGLRDEPRRALPVIQIEPARACGRCLLVSADFALESSVQLKVGHDGTGKIGFVQPFERRFASRSSLGLKPDAPEPPAGEANVMKRAKGHLKKLQAADTCHLLQAVLQAYLVEPSSCDARISLAGAMHQSSWLAHQIAPYLSDWKVEESIWIRRCLERQLKTFPGDPLAVSALVLSRPEAFFAIARELFPSLVYARSWQDGGLHLRVILCTAWNTSGSSKNWAHRCIELAWKEGAAAFSEVHYVKVISGDERAEHLHGHCQYSSWTTAHLPHGYWVARDSLQELGQLSEVQTALTQLPAWVTS